MNALGGPMREGAPAAPMKMELCDQSEVRWRGLAPATQDIRLMIRHRRDVLSISDIAHAARDSVSHLALD